MTIPTCTITGSIFDLLDSDDDGAIEAVALEDVNVTFTPNTKGQLVAIGNVLYRPEPVTVTVDAAGKINGNAGVTLLANDESLDLEIPLQWRVSFTDLPTGGFTKDIRPFWFEAPEDGETATLADLAAVPGTTATGFTKGDKGDTGPQGAAATISVGTVTTGAAGSSASVTNAGSSGAAVFNFTIPRGDTGPAASWTNVTDKPAVIAAGATQAEARTAIGAEASANKGVANGYASLDASALVPSTQLPSYVDDVLEYANVAAFPATGEANKIYIAANTGRSYRWSGSVYVEIVASPGTTDNITEGSTNLWYTNTRADARISAAIGSTVQAYDADLTAFAGKTAPSGAVVGTSDVQALTNKDLSGAGNTFPTFNQSTTGNAATATKLATARTISGVSFDGSANIDVVTPATVGANYFSPGYVAGNYYYCNSANASGTSATQGNGNIRVSAWVVHATITVERLFAEFTVAGEANSVYRIGIWNHDPSTGKPGSLVLDAGTISTGTGNAGNVSTSGTPGVYEITVSQSLSPGVYWVGGAIQGATTTQPTMRTIGAAGVQFHLPIGTSLPASPGTALHTGFNLTGQTGAFGTLTSATTLATSSAGFAARIGFKVT